MQLASEEPAMANESEEMRKGPWTKAEDLQLACSVTFFGDRRWDFIARVSGLNRTGKSCRMRWLNYLHPSLKRGRMTPQEEGLILELHSRWGNRWSRIARRLPGRTDNEIKNYWRTHMRKKAQEQRETLSAFSPSASSSPTSASPSEPPPPPPPPLPEFTDDGQLSGTCSCCSMDQIWDEIDVSEEITALIFHE